MVALPLFEEPGLVANGVQVANVAVQPVGGRHPVERGPLDHA